MQKNINSTDTNRAKYGYVKIVLVNTSVSLFKCKQHKLYAVTVCKLNNFYSVSFIIITEIHTER